MTLTGSTMKEETRTTITLLQGSNDRETGLCPSFVLKIYRYPHIAPARTIGQLPKAQREYRGLKRCQEFSVPAAQPVGFGVEKGLGGVVRSCFVITYMVEHAMDFRAWLKQKENEEYLERHNSMVAILRQVGQHMRRLHKEHFFLMRPTLRNILLCDFDTPCPKPIFIDLAYARFLPMYLPPHYGQRADFGQFFGPLLRRCSEAIIEPFLETYLPDPNGQTAAGLRQLILQAARIHNNQTPLAWATHGIHRNVKNLRQKLFGKQQRNSRNRQA